VARGYALNMTLKEYRNKRRSGRSPEPAGKDEAWLLVKKSDDDSDGRRKPVRRQPESVLSGRTLDELT
jgi:hypothetical protein